MKKKGFTLIEMVVVMAIVLILGTFSTLSVIKMIERNDYKKIETIIPKMISVEAIKAFEEGDDKVVEINMDSDEEYIKSENSEQQLPKSYTYSIYLVARKNSGEMKSSGTVEIGSSGKAYFKIDGEGKLGEIQIDSGDTYEDLTEKYHPAILVEKNDVPFCRVDTISSKYITPKIYVYKPNDDATSEDMGDESKWTLDN
ncbi:prepilin-type N-terminal cleavage/methylation domain-containing protein [uncultured Ilyobacter sp.]|uniref:prepilin-type N-terminal cleavage/methylation domain-containing protein n=1 Tax=uncultured Ilyobacter sp. TaxID=544433 RepID=UPI002AA661CB|nr:prepilin-type N-terminal cleavage/methylation domain-containing protein [uncultured Ilyobacter sp.]